MRLHLAYSRRLLLLCACLFACAEEARAWRQFLFWNDSHPCAAAFNPTWPFAYAKSGATSVWEPKGRTASNLQSLGHVCTTGGARSQCYVCENFACSSSANGTCALQIQGMDWSALPRNVPTVIDTPFAVGARVRHRHDFGVSDRVCVLLSPACITREDAIAAGAGACPARCWNAGDVRPPVPYSKGWVSYTTSAARQGSVTTAAGTGRPGWTDGPARNASFRAPQGIALDYEDNVYVADTGNHVIRVMWRNGTVSTYAGAGSAGLRDGPVSTALFSSPGGLAVYAECSGLACVTVVVVADSHNHRIRKIRAGVVTTLAGGANVTADENALSPSGYADGTGASARFDTPLAVAADDDGNVFVADYRNSAIRYVHPNGTVRTLVGVSLPSVGALPGCPAPCVSGVRGYLDGIIVSAEVGTPVSIALGPGNPYTLVFSDGQRVRIVGRRNENPFAAAEVFGGIGMTRRANLSSILSLSFVSTLAGGILGGVNDWFSESATFDVPRGIVVGTDGRTYVSDALRCRIRVVNVVAHVAQDVACSARAIDVHRPAGCTSFDSPSDSTDRVLSPVIGNVRYNANASSSATSLSLDGRRLPACLGVPPPDISLQATGITLGSRVGTRSANVLAEEDTAPGSAYVLRCGGGCAGTGVVYGTDVYADVSHVCAAAQHAGLISAVVGGTFVLTLQKGIRPGTSNATLASLGSQLQGSIRNGVASLSATAAVRTFQLSAINEPLAQPIVQSIAGAPAGSLESACGSIDAAPPTGARFAGPVAVALRPNSSLTLASPLYVVDARSHSIRLVSPTCAQICENGGVCAAQDQCACAPGWSGFDCTIAVCVPTCAAGRICTAPNTCSCYPGYTGASCEQAQCAQTCHNGGSCSAPDTCACISGWFGTNCTVPVCSQTCGNGGNCTGPDTCTCPSWWTGADCRTPICPQSCLNGGTCVSPRTCSCAPGWSGHNCGQPVCNQGMLRRDPIAAFGASPARPSSWSQFDVCHFREWCAVTNDFECLQQQRGRRPITLPGNRSESGFRNASTGCVLLELPITLVTPFRYRTELNTLTEYWREAPVRPYEWGPNASSHVWSSPTPAAPDRQLAFVAFTQVDQGVYVCANGGNCTAPDQCTCAPGWVGFDCRTPVCTQGFYLPARVDSRFPGSQGTYLVSGRTLTVWENPLTPTGKFPGYLHDHPNFHSQLIDMSAILDLPTAYFRTSPLGDGTREGWRRAGWWLRVPLVQWQRGTFPLLFNRTCPGNVVKTRQVLTNATASPVSDTFVSYAPQVSYNPRAVVAVGRWDETDGECVDEVLLGCFNGGVCEAPNQCRCAAGWIGDDCTLPLCPFTVANVSAAPDVPMTLLRNSSRNHGSATGHPRPLPGDQQIQYFKCPNNGNCTHPGVCTCEKGWTGEDCRTPLCAQECFNGGRCIAPDTCECREWSSTYLDRRNVPLFRKPDGSAQSTGWTGYDCNTPVCVQASQFILNDDTGQYPVELVSSANDGRTFQAACPGVGRFTPPERNRTSPVLCALAQWWMGNYRDTSANAPAVSMVSAGRRVRINFPNYQYDTSIQGWRQGAPMPGEGIYACYNGGSCVAPDTCECSDGWFGFDCNAPTCLYNNTYGTQTTCLHGSICSKPNTCTCPSVPSTVAALDPDLPQNAATGWLAQDCSMAKCVQGFFDAECKDVPPGDGGVASAGIGCYRCANGGNCTAPDTCTCAPGWTGWDCRQPVCNITMTRRLQSDLSTVDPDIIQQLQNDPCGSQLTEDWGGTSVPRGFCSRPNTCTCSCRLRAYRGVDGKLVQLPFTAPDAPQPGYTYGTLECLDGWEGAKNADGTFQTCHLRIFKPSELQRTYREIITGGVLGFVGLLALLLLIRYRVRQLEKRRAEQEKKREAAAQEAAAAAAETLAEERRKPPAGPQPLLAAVPQLLRPGVPTPGGKAAQRARRRQVVPLG